MVIEFKSNKKNIKNSSDVPIVYLFYNYLNEYTQWNRIISLENGFHCGSLEYHLIDSWIKPEGEGDSNIDMFKCLPLGYYTCIAGCEINYYNDTESNRNSSKTNYLIKLLQNLGYDQNALNNMGINYGNIAHVFEHYDEGGLIHNLQGEAQVQEQVDDDSWRTSEDEGEGEDGDGEMHEDGEDQSDATDMKDVSDMDNKDATGQDNQNGN
eukprot:Mrub_08726.p1 GENE.Mrub_08726~~Mrub_08726.p1  ORF type:complete len:244 (-),score=50.99 Mrub_08726:77-706(-)